MKKIVDFFLRAKRAKWQPLTESEKAMLRHAADYREAQKTFLNAYCAGGTWEDYTPQALNKYYNYIKL